MKSFITITSSFLISLLVIVISYYCWGALFNHYARKETVHRQEPILGSSGSGDIRLSEGMKEAIREVVREEIRKELSSQKDSTL